MLTKEQAQNTDFIKSILSDYFDITKIEIKHSSDTYNSFAYELNNEIIVRFPCREVAKDKLIKEHQVLNILQNKISLEIPYTSLQKTPYLYLWHKKIEGNHLTQDELSKWTSENKKIFYKDIAVFIYELNKLTDEILKTIRLPLWKKFEKMDSSEKILDFYEQNQNFSTDEKKFIKSFLKTFNLKNDNEIIKFCHFDIMGKNMAVDNDVQKLIGIYDFGECAIGDIHKEFCQTALNFNYETISKIIKEYEIMSDVNINIHQVEGYAFYTWLEFCYRYNASDFAISGVKNKIQDMQCL